MRATPWQNRKALHKQIDSADGMLRGRWDAARRRAALSGKRLWVVLAGKAGYLCATFGCIAIFVLLFQPWLTTSTGGTDGSIHTNAFGRVHVTTFWVDLWSQSSGPAPKVSGVWGILASVAIGIAVSSMAVDSAIHTKALTHLAIVATILVAVFTVATALYLNSTGDDLTRVVSYGTARDPGTQIGLLIRWASGYDNYPVPGFRRVTYATAHLTRSAILAAAISLFSAVAAIAQWTHGRPHRQRTEPGDRNPA